MARAEFTLRFKDIDRMKLFVYQLQELRSQMVIEANPRASDLDKIIDRFISGGDDERGPDKENPPAGSPS